MVKREQLPKLLSLGYVHLCECHKGGRHPPGWLVSATMWGSWTFLIYFLSPWFQGIQGLHQRLPPPKSLPWLSDPSRTHPLHPHFSVFPLHWLCIGSRGIRFFSLFLFHEEVISVVSGTSGTQSEPPVTVELKNKVKSTNGTAKVKIKNGIVFYYPSTYTFLLFLTLRQACS